MADTLAVHDIEFDLAKGRGHLVLHYLHAGPVANHLLAVLEGADAPDVEPHAGVELQCIATRRGLGTAKHHADLHADLVDEDDQGIGLGDGAGQLAQGLAHQARVQANVGIAHLAFEFGARRERGDRIDHHHVDRARANQHLGDFQSLLAVVGLRDQKIVGLHTQLARVTDVERVLGVYEGADTARTLRLRHDVQCERGLARGFRPVDLDDAPARQAADAERDVEPERAGGNNLNVVIDAAVAHLHDRTLAELLFDLGQRRCQCFRLVVVHCVSFVLIDGNYLMFNGAQPVRYAVSKHCNYIQY